jgi:hypothetical protein
VLKRRDLIRRSAIVALGAATLPAVPVHGREIPPDYDASLRLRRPDWAPVFLSEHQSRTLESLGEWIIPETETPGAKSALVHRFLDHLLAAETPEVQREFTSALAFVDGLSQERYGRAFIYLETEQQRELLTYLAYPHRLVTWGSNRSEFVGHTLFARLKDWIARAYYSSPEGLAELGFDEAFSHGPFLGCEQESSNH